VAVAALAVATAAAGAPPVITRQPPPTVAVKVGWSTTISAAARGATTLQWETAWSSGSSWRDVDGATGASLTYAPGCPNGAPTSDYRLRACNADGCTWSAVSSWNRISMPLPVWVSTPPPVLPANATARWVVVTPVDLHSLRWRTKIDGGPPGAKVPAVRMLMGLPLPRGQRGWEMQMSDVPPGARAIVSVWLHCGGGHGLASDFLEAGVSVPGPTPLAAACPAWVNPATADARGLVLSDGHTFLTPTCAACRAACAGLPGCTTWVWGANPAVPGRYRQCWLKARMPYRTPRPVATDSSSTWVSGKLPYTAKTPCPGEWETDYEGRVLVAGDSHKVRTCTACAAACRARRDCNVWVWGFAALRGRHQECWLKRWEGGKWPATKTGSFTTTPWLAEANGNLTTSPWLAGVIRDRLAAPAVGGHA